MCVRLSGLGTGTEAAGALGLPEGGGDPVLHRGRPEQTINSHQLSTRTESLCAAAGHIYGVPQRPRIW